MNILIFNWRDLTHPWSGGAEVFLHEVARRWVRLGHHVTWFCGRHASQPTSEQIEGIQIIRRGGIFSVYLHAACHYLSRLRHTFDAILDSANGVPFFTPMFSDTPSILMVHHIHREVFFRELPWHLAHLGNALERYLMPLIYRRTPVVTVSESSRRALIEIGVSPAQISLLYNAVDHADYHPGPKSDKPLMLYLGRLRHYKSVDVAIRALPEVLCGLPSLQFSIVGSGLAEDSLRSLARDLGVMDHIEFHGYVPEAEKIRLLQRANVVVNTSMKEGWGLSVLEANACGTPVIAANVPGLRDSVRHGRTGLLVPYGDPKALAESLRDLLTDHPKRAQMRQNAMDWAAQFDWDETARRGLKLLAQCRDRSRSA